MWYEKIQQFWHKMLRPLELIDDMVKTFFQKITDLTGFSNYRMGQICFWLMALNALMWVEKVLTVPTLIWFVFQSAFSILGIFILDSLEKAGDNAPKNVWVYLWSRFYPCGIARGILVIVFVYGFGENVSKLIRFSRATDVMMAIDMFLLLPMLYFPACVPPPTKRNKEKSRKRPSLAG